MHRCTSLLRWGAALVWLWPTSAMAHCEPEKFDRTPPAAITGTVEDPTSRFEWSSDVDIQQGRSWRRNYILNTHTDRGWSGNWQKADIFVAISRPLPPRQRLCREVLLGQHRDDPDTDAPLFMAQTAATCCGLYRTAAGQNVINCQLAVVFQTPSGLKEAHYDISLVWKGAADYQLSIVNYGDQSLIFGVSNLEEVISGSELNAMEASLRSSGSFVRISTLEEAVGASLSRSRFPAEWDVHARPFIFFSGNHVRPMRSQRERRRRR